MIYIFDNKQKIIKVLTNEDLTAGHLDFKINTATTFEFSLPANKPLSSSAKFVAVPHPLDDSKFIMLRLTERTDNADTIDYSAYELAYQELATYGYIEDKRPAETDAKTLMGIALNGTNWKLNNVNVAGTAKTNFYYMDHLTAISNVVDLLGGEIVFYVEIESNAISGRYMDYLARQGEDTSKVFAKGSNLLTIERQSDTSGIYTAILPRGKGVETDGDNDASTPDGYGRRLNIADAVWKKSSGKPLDKPAGEIILYDPTANAEWGQIDGNYRLLLETYDEIDDVNTLINSAYKTLQSVNHPKIQYSATVADVGGLSLGDTVLIVHSERDLSYKTRVFEVNYDLLDPAQTEISLGDDLSSNDITSQINRVSSSQSIASEQTQWTINQVGRNPVTFGTVAPENPKVGDTFFKYLPNGDTVVYEWNGEIWVEKVSSNISEQIDLAVEDTIETAKSQAAAMDEVRASEAAVFQSAANAALSSAAVERAVFSSNAASMANSASAHADTVANSASAYAKAQANSALSSANSELAKAKQELGSEVSKAQSDIVATNKELAGKVSQADFDTVTGDLTTKYGQVKATADAVTADVAKYETANDKKVSANTASINALNNQITSKVSQTDFDKTTGDLSGKYSIQQQTINGISQTVTELQAKANAQGQVNQLANTEFKPDYSGWTINEPRGSHRNKLNMAYKGSTIFEYDSRTGGGIADTGSVWLFSDEIPINYGSPLSMSVVAKTIFVPTDETTSYFVVQPRFTLKDGTAVYGDDLVRFKSGDNNSDWVYGKVENLQIPNNTVSVCLYSWIRGSGVVVRLAQPMLVFDNKIGDYVAGNYNNNARVAELELGIDHITGLVNDPKNGLSATATLAANGLSIATKAQSDATTAIQTAQGTQTTVTSVQKDVKDLQSTTTQTAGQVTTEIEDRKNGDKNTLTQTSQMISEQIADYNLGVMLNINAMANGITASVGNNNLIPNSEFEPMGSKWYLFNDRSVGAMIGNELVGSTAMSPTVQYKDWSIVNGSQGIAYSTKDWYISELIRTNDGNVFSMSLLAGRSDPDNGPTGVFDFRLAFFDKNKKLISLPKGTNPIQNVAKSDIQLYVNENITPPTGTYYVAFVLGHNSAVTDAIYQPMLNYGSKALKYTPKYGTDSESTILQLFKDHWAIGIQDNAFEMVSGIIGDATSMNLISNHITLQGTTTVTEDFYAKGGNFKNLNASNITTGTINAAKINVINLDVSSLSGNITNFVKSYWNSAYSNVKIDGNGMVVSTDESKMEISSTGFSVTTGRSVTELSNGKIDYTSDTAERIGYTGWLRLENTTVDYLSIILKGWHTTKKDDTFWTGGSKNFYGGDGIKFGITNANYSVTDLLVWNSQYASSQTSYPQGWTMLDDLQHFGNEEKYGNLNLHGHFDVPGSYQALQFRPIIYNGTTYPAMMGSDKGTSGGAILFGSEEIYLKHGNNVVSLADVARKAGYNI